MEYDVWTRSLWDWCDELTSDPHIVSKFRWNAERVFKYNQMEGKYQRLITEPWTADSWWKVQASFNSSLERFCSCIFTYSPSKITRMKSRKVDRHSAFFYTQTRRSCRPSEPPKGILFSLDVQTCPLVCEMELVPLEGA